MQVNNVQKCKKGIEVTFAWLWSGRPDFLSTSITTPSGLLGRYTPTSTTIFAISSSILALNPS